ncbi:MAG: hypothetical protein WC979_05310 [Candidatus Pacearchaeota archaeon]|jgi:hypothetical protein
MTKVLKLGRNQEEAEIGNYFSDNEGVDVAGTWFSLYEDNEHIENQNPEHIKIIAKYLINNGFSRSGEHLLKNLNLLWESCKLEEMKK